MYRSQNKHYVWYTFRCAAFLHRRVLPHRVPRLTTGQSKLLEEPSRGFESGGLFRSAASASHVQQCHKHTHKYCCLLTFLLVEVRATRLQIAYPAQTVRPRGHGALPRTFVSYQPEHKGYHHVFNFSTCMQLRRPKQRARARAGRIQSFERPR
jgi:hypothetical protein